MTLVRAATKHISVEDQQEKENAEEDEGSSSSLSDYENEQQVEDEEETINQPNASSQENKLQMSVKSKENKEQEPWSSAGKSVTRNVQAIKVIKRIKKKLEGKDEDSPIKSKLTLEQQVDWLIKEATSTKNLSRLYEGWTPWC